LIAPAAVFCSKLMIKDQLEHETASKARLNCIISNIFILFPENTGPVLSSLQWPYDNITCLSKFFTSYYPYSLENSWKRIGNKVT